MEPNNKKEKMPAMAAFLNGVAWLFIFEVLFSIVQAISLPEI
jgi:hypothetical protein